MNKDKRMRKYGRQAKMYGSNRTYPKMEAWRSRLIKKAYGKVLEVGIGAGANFAYYDRNSVEVTGVDFSSEMIRHAKAAAANYQVSAQFIEEDMDELNLEPNTFDCIVSTLTLCSYPDPVKILNQFNHWCRKDGKILLIEHGLSSNRILSFTQHIIDPLFIKVSGCHCNRDMYSIVEKSNLEVVHMERYWSDIFYVVEAKPT